MPGYERTRFVGVSDNDLEEFICGICLAVFVKPMVTECCGQTYCFECISDWLLSNPTCPNDRKRLTMDKLKSAPKMVNNLLSNMKIKCEYQEKGCQSIMNISDLDSHLNNDCAFNPFRKCRKCNSLISNHTDKMCSDILFKNLTVKTAQLENLQRSFDGLVKNKEQDQIEIDSYISALLCTIQRLENQLEQANKLLKDITPVDSTQAIADVLHSYPKNPSSPPKVTPIQNLQSPQPTAPPCPNNEYRNLLRNWFLILIKFKPFPFIFQNRRGLCDGWTQIRFN